MKYLIFKAHPRPLVWKWIGLWLCMLCPMGAMAQDGPPAAVINAVRVVDERTVSAPVTNIIALQYANAADVAVKVRPMLKHADSEVAVDPADNKIIITDTLESVEQIRRRIQELDRKDRAVHIRSSGMEIILTDEYARGVDWGGVLNRYAAHELGEDCGDLSGAACFGRLSFGTVSSEDRDILIDALDAVGITNPIPGPTLTLDKGPSGVITLGKTEFADDVGVASSTMMVIERVNLINLSVTLHVKAEVLVDGMVRLSVLPEVRSVGDKKASDEQEFWKAASPVTMEIRPGDVIVIGGFLKEEDVETIKKIPLLGDLPILGFAFRNQDRSTRKTEMVLFLTPTLEGGSRAATLR